MNNAACWRDVYSFKQLDFHLHTTLTSIHILTLKDGLKPFQETRISEPLGLYNTSITPWQLHINTSIMMMSFARANATKNPVYNCCLFCSNTRIITSSSTQKKQEASHFHSYLVSHSFFSLLLPSAPSVRPQAADANLKHAITGLHSFHPPCLRPKTQTSLLH